MSFQNLKKQSKLGSLTEKLMKEMEKMSSPTSNVDDRFWKPEMGKEGVGSAVIRFLPPPEGEDVAWVQLYKHAFRGPTNQWYIENCLSTIKQKDPVNDYNRGLVGKYGGDLDKCPVEIQNKVRDQKRKLSYYCNIYVVKDPANPENQGKVFLYRFGQKIFDKIMKAMKPEFEDETAVDVFDFWKGANFKLRLSKKAGYWNYDDSVFDSPSALSDDDDELEKIWKQQYSLQAIIAPDQFKSYEDLQRRLNSVLDIQAPVRAVMEQEEALESYRPTSNEMDELDRAYARSKSPAASFSNDDDDDEEVSGDATLSYFKALIDE